MKVGDVVENAIWITGDEAPGIRQQYEQDVRNAITDLCTTEGVEHGPVTFVEKIPGSDRVPQVPDHVQGSRVRLLVAEAVVVGLAVQTSQGSFVANLEKKDLVRLRTITRRAWAKQHPDDVLTDKQCDDYIEQLGPDTAVDMIRAQYATLQ
jgi:hypothetical protein